MFCANSLPNIREHLSFRETDMIKQLELFLPEQWPQLDENDKKAVIDSIRDVFKLEYRKYLSVFYLGRDPSLTDTIFKAIDDGKTICILSGHCIK